VRHAGFLDGFELTSEEAEALIMQARLKVGWITEADLAPKEAEVEEQAETTEAGA
jgi:N utilization substance protein A